MPHGYTNDTTRDGSSVTKAYLGPDATGRCDREAAMLTALAGILPVPPLVARDGRRLGLGYLPGTHGQDLIGRGQARQVLTACGRMLRRIHAIDPERAGIRGPHPPGAVLVHGDYGPNNTLLGPGAREVTAVLDWEWAHAGAPVEDLAWCEWIVRMHHPGDAGALDEFFGAYRLRPAWAARHEAMLARCRAMLDLCERWRPDGEAVPRWRDRLAITASWTE